MLDSTFVSEIAKLERASKDGEIRELDGISYLYHEGRHEPILFEPAPQTMEFTDLAGLVGYLNGDAPYKAEQLCQSV